VIQMLTGRGRRLDLHHYEALVDVHVLHEDLHKIFIVLCIMAKAGLSPDTSSTRTVYQLLEQSPNATDEALGVLQALRQQHQVPIAAFNVVLEAAIVHHGFKRALDLYRSMRRICGASPDLTTFHILLSQCNTKKSFRFLVGEMEAFSVRPTKLTYDHFIRICSTQDDYELAFHYLEKLRTTESSSREEDSWMSQDAAVALIGRCIAAEDSRVHGIIDECRKRGIRVDTEVQRLVEESRRKQQESSGSATNVPTQIPAVDATPASLSDSVEDGSVRQSISR
jgi:hypothetical protein